MINLLLFSDGAQLELRCTSMIRSISDAVYDRMVKKTKAQHQAEYLKYANHLLQYAVALDHDDDDIEGKRVPDTRLAPYGMKRHQC